MILRCFSDIPRHQGESEGRCGDGEHDRGVAEAEEERTGEDGGGGSGEGVGEHGEGCGGSAVGVGGGGHEQVVHAGGGHPLGGGEAEVEDDGGAAGGSDGHQCEADGGEGLGGGDSPGESERAEEERRGERADELQGLCDREEQGCVLKGNVEVAGEVDHREGCEGGLHGGPESDESDEQERDLRQTEMAQREQRGWIDGVWRGFGQMEARERDEAEQSDGARGEEDEAFERGGLKQDAGVREPARKVAAEDSAECAGAEAGGEDEAEACGAVALGGEARDGGKEADTPEAHGEAGEEGESDLRGRSEKRGAKDAAERSGDEAEEEKRTNAEAARQDAGGEGADE